MKLYGSTISRAHRVMWMLKELAIPFQHIPINFLDGSTRHPDFLKINPNGRVPAIEDDAVILFESMAINLYLARKYTSALSPADLVEDALATQWSFWVITEIEKPLLLAAANSFLFEERLRNEEEKHMALLKLDRPWTVLEKRLSRSPFLIGERFTVADLNVAAVMDLIPTLGISLAKYPSMNAWLRQCLDRPAADDWKTVKFTIPRPPTPLGVLGMFV